MTRKSQVTIRKVQQENGDWIVFVDLHYPDGVTSQVTGTWKKPFEPHIDIVLEEKLVCTFPPDPMSQ